MTNEPQNSPWYQSNLGAGIAAGLVLLVLSWIFVPLVEPLSVALRALAIASVLLVGLVVFSLISRTWRTRIWIAVGEWVGGLGVLTNKKRARIRKAGFNARSAEIEEERARVRQPRWTFEARDALGQSRLYWLNNHGGAATSVHVTADPEFFVLDGEIFWNSTSDAGPMGGYVGQWFKGYPTARGRAEGVLFHVSWVDTAGDARDRDVFMASEEIMTAQDEVIREAWAEGRAAGRLEMVEEIKNERADAYRPLVRAQWIVVQTDEEFHWTLKNMAAGSVAKHVSIEVSPKEFRAASALDWESVDGMESVEFIGEPLEVGFDYGVTYRVSWTDVHDRRQAIDVFWEA